MAKISGKYETIFIVNPFFVWYYHLAPMGKLWAFSEISYRSAQSVCRYRDNLNQFWR